MARANDARLCRFGSPLNYRDSDRDRDYGCENPTGELIRALGAIQNLKCRGCGLFA
jgi:hypothetical protein